MACFVYIENEKIIGNGFMKMLSEGVLNIEVDFDIYNNIEKYIYKDGEIVINENYEQEQLEKEKERIQELSMTRSDFFDGTIQAWGVGQDELLILIQGLLATLPIEDVKKLMAINNFKNALNFYRKHDLFKMLVGYAIPLNETYQITIMDDDLDKFFDEVDKGNKATAWEYLPKPELITVEPPVPEDETIEEQITEE